MKQKSPINTIRQRGFFKKRICPKATSFHFPFAFNGFFTSFLKGPYFDEDTVSLEKEFWIIIFTLKIPIELWKIANLATKKF
jgi:hypothetical protein